MTRHTQIANASSSSQSSGTLPESAPAPRRERTWLYVRIYCPPALHDDAILHLIQPAVDELKARGRIERAFFIRYNEGGNHLRLRVLGRREDVLRHARNYLNQQIEAFFAAHGEIVAGPLDTGPDGMDDPRWSPRQPYSVQRPLYSYEYDRYIPEYNRYGGGLGLLVSERHFDASSHITFQVLARARRFRGSRQTAALFLMVGACAAFGMSDEEKVDAFARQSCYWVRSRLLTPTHMRWFDETYQRQQETLRRLFSLAQPSAVESRSGAFWLPIVEQWQRNLSATYDELLALKRQGKLEAPLSVVALFYIHMLCNRLGILPPEEACLAYILHRHYAEQLGQSPLDFLNTSEDELDEAIAPMMSLALADRETVKRLSAIGGVPNEIRWDRALPAQWIKPQ